MDDEQRTAVNKGPGLKHAKRSEELPLASNLADLQRTGTFDKHPRVAVWNAVGGVDTYIRIGSVWAAESARIAADAEMGEGTVVCPEAKVLEGGVDIGYNATIGPFSQIGLPPRAFDYKIEPVKTNRVPKRKKGEEDKEEDEEEEKEVDLPSRLANKKVEIGDGVSIGSNVNIEQDVEIGGGTEIGDLSLIQHGARIGCNVKIGSSASIGRNASIGSNVVIYDGESIKDYEEVPDGALIGFVSRTIL